MYDPVTAFISENKSCNRDGFSRYYLLIIYDLQYYSTHSQKNVLGTFSFSMDLIYS